MQASIRMVSSPYNMSMSEPQMTQIYAREEVPQVMMATARGFVERVDDAAVKRLTTKATFRPGDLHGRCCRPHVLPAGCQKTLELELYPKLDFFFQLTTFREEKNIESNLQPHQTLIFMLSFI